MTYICNLSSRFHFLLWMQTSLFPTSSNVTDDWVNQEQWGNSWPSPHSSLGIIKNIESCMMDGGGCGLVISRIARGFYSFRLLGSEFLIFPWEGNMFHQCVIWSKGLWLVNQPWKYFKNAILCFTKVPNVQTIGLSWQDMLKFLSLHYTCSCCWLKNEKHSCCWPVKHLWPQYRPNRRRGLTNNAVIMSILVVIQLASLAIWLYRIRYCNLVNSDVAETTATRGSNDRRKSFDRRGVVFQCLTNSSPYIIFC